MATTTSANAISSAMRAYGAQVGDGGLAAGLAIPDGQGGELRVRVANDRPTRASAFGLAFRVYDGRGYVRDRAHGMLVAPIDALPGTIVFLAETAAGEAAATVSVVADSAAGLQADALYRPELDALRRAGCRLTEVTRLAIDPRFAHSRPLLARAIDLCYLSGRRVHGSTDAVIEVNPRHVSFYQRLVGFAPLCAPRICPRVGAPGVLMWVEIAHMARMVAQWSGAASPTTAGSLYALFHPPGAEARIARAIAEEHQPMDADDLAWFDLALPPSARSA